MQNLTQNLTKSLLELISIQSVEEKELPGKPFGEGVFKALEYVLSLCRSFGFETKNIDGYCGYAEVGEGELFGVLSHLDTVPIGDGWTHNPLGEIDGNRLYGRGTQDDKGPALSAVYALKKLVDEGLPFKKRIRLIFGCDEESGWKCMDRYLKTEELPVMGFSPDSDFPVINCEKGIVYYEVTTPLADKIISFEGGTRPNVVPDFAEVKIRDISERTLEFAKKLKLEILEQEDAITVIRSHGVSAHGSCPQKGDNALWKMFALLDYAYGGIFTVIHSKLCSYSGENCGLDLSDTISGSLTMNLGVVKTIGREMHFSLDIRYPISYSKEDIYEILKEQFDECNIITGLYHNPLYVDKDHVLIKTLLEAYEAVTGTKGECITIGGGTYARMLPLGVAFGPIFPNRPSTIHQKDEYIEIEDLTKMTLIYYEALKRLCC